MFTGIIESMGRITSVELNGTNRSFRVESPISTELKVDQSISHNGVCLTVEEVYENTHRVTAIHETLEKTNLGSWKTGDLVNLERCMPAAGRFDGHFVQGHADCTATCTGVKDMNGSWECRFEFPEQFSGLIVEKGSIALNGISLTIFDIGLNRFSVAIIPYTFEHTNMNRLQPGDTVNLEFDIIGKYVVRNILKPNFSLL